MKILQQILIKVLQTKNNSFELCKIYAYDYWDLGVLQYFNVLIL